MGFDWWEEAGKGGWVWSGVQQCGREGGSREMCGWVGGLREGDWCSESMDGSRVWTVVLDHGTADEFERLLSIMGRLAGVDGCAASWNGWRACRAAQRRGRVGRRAGVGRIMKKSPGAGTIVAREKIHRICLSVLFHLNILLISIPPELLELNAS